jgi:hypothetical protein
LLAVDDRGHPEHLAHPWASDRAFVPQDQHLAGVIGSRLDGTNTVFLAFEYASRPVMDDLAKSVTVE